MGGSLSLETPIPDTPTGHHLSQLDQTTQICLELWALPFVLNLEQLDSLENTMTVDLLRQLILAVEIRLLARLTCNPKRDSLTLCLGASHATCRPGYSFAQDKIVANIRLHGG